MVKPSRHQRAASMRFAIALLATALSAACRDSPDAPSSQPPLRLTASITQTVVTRGSTSTIIFRLENLTSETVKIDFGSSCQIMPFISHRSDARLVYPNGGWACLAVITELTLPPGGSVTREVLVQAAETADYPYVALSPGEYVSYAKLDDQQYRLQSAPVSFTAQ
jgi:hypothetical protein